MRRAGAAAPRAMNRGGAARDERGVMDRNEDGG